MAKSRVPPRYSTRRPTRRLRRSRTSKRPRPREKALYTLTGHRAAAAASHVATFTGLVRFRRFGCASGYANLGMVAFRTAMDHPDAVTRLVVRTVPGRGASPGASTRRSCAPGGTGGFSARPRSRRRRPQPRSGCLVSHSSPAEMGEENHADVWAALRDPAVVHGMCEDYRAGLRIDRAHEEADGPRVAESRARCSCCRDRGRHRHPR